LVIDGRFVDDHFVDVLHPLQSLVICLILASMTDTRGPRAVRAALVDAAVDLFADKGDASVRAVAGRAGVNHGLVHHYLGSKQGLRAAVLDRLSAAIYGEVEPHDESLRELAFALLRRTERDPRFVKILARALLDGELPEQLQSKFPVVDRLRAAASSVDPDLARAGIAEGLALSLGTMVFAPWIRAALGLGAGELERIRDSALERIFTQLDEPDEPASSTAERK
jgi:AcrR family transcriptional regulator